MKFSRGLAIFTIAWRMEFEVSLRLLWHVPRSQQKLLAVLVLGRYGFRILSTLGAVCLNVLWAHVKSV